MAQTYQDKQQKRRNDPRYFLNRTYDGMKRRCLDKTRPTYFGLNICSREEFVENFANDIKFIKLFSEWRESNYSYKKVPSIDRINNRQGYVIDNLQFLTTVDNINKDRQRKPVNVFKINGDPVGMFSSISEASRVLDIERSNLSLTANGLRKHASGYVVKRETKKTG